MKYHNPATGDIRRKNGTTFVVTNREKSRVHYRTVRGPYRHSGWVADLAEWRAFFAKSITRIPETKQESTP